MSVQASLVDLRARLDAVVPAIAAVDVACLTAVHHELRGGFAVTGIGASRVAARLLASTLGDLGVEARFVPLSAFAEATVVARPGEALCVFSQGLSPNARLALRKAAEFRQCHLFTSLPEGADSLASFRAAGGHVLTLPPAHESRSLLRVVGPSVAMLAATLFAYAVAARPLRESIGDLLTGLEASRRAAREAVDGLSDDAKRAPVAFLVGSSEPSLADGLALKWIEALGGSEPPTWDNLEIAHGPFQAFHDEPRLLVALGPRSALHDRLASMLDPRRHTLLRFVPSVAPPFHRLEIEVCVNELLFACFAQRPRDLSSWSSQGKDDALYGLGE